MKKVNTSIRLDALLRTELKDLCEANGIPITKAIERLIVLLKSDIVLQQRVFKELKR
jgi:uncharacterized lipoprotein YehR (DUF1307 family)